MTGRVAVIGGGILGAAIAREILQRQPDADVTVIEKEDRIASHQTGRNSGVVHAGLYYQPGSAKALLCRRGVSLLEAFCEERGIRRIACGKVLVALDDVERGRLDDIEARALANGVPGVRIIGAAEPQRARAACTWCRRPTLPIHLDRQLHRGDTGAGRRRRRRGREDPPQAR